MRLQKLPQTPSHCKSPTDLHTISASIHHLILRNTVHHLATLLPFAPSTLLQQIAPSSRTIPPQAVLPTLARTLLPPFAEESEDIHYRKPRPTPLACNIPFRCQDAS